MALQPTKRLFTVAEYYRMAEAGILGEDDHVELIEGEIIQMSPIGPRHSGGVGRLTSLFSRIFGASAIVWVQNPVRLGERCEPEPDLALLKPRADFYASAHPTSADVLLVVEVADSSVDYDRGVKAPLYARSGIPEYWLDDVGQQHVTIYREPTPDGYAVVRVARRGETIRPVMLPDLEVAVDDILG
jgi:Uma2 family endonuclease